jgi:acyl-CoA hydrolase
MPNELTAEQAAARLETDDTLGMPLGPGQPPAFMRALGEREDWTDLRVYGALLAVGTELFSRTGVAYLSGFFGPIERALRDAGANIEFASADFRRFGPLLELQRPRVMTTVATPPDTDGWCSLSLHAGGTVGALRRAGADPERLLVVEVSNAYPRTFGLGEDHRHALHVDEIDILVRSTEAPLALPGGGAPPTDVDTAIARHAVDFVRPARPCRRGSARFQPDRHAVSRGEGGDCGCTARCSPTAACNFTAPARSPTPARASTTVSVTTFAFSSTGSRVAGRQRRRRVLPVEIVNPGCDRRSTDMVTINGARDRHHGQVVCRHDLGDQFSGIGGAEDFVAGAGLELSDRSLICLPSTFEKDDILQSRIVPWFGPGAVITTPRHQVDVIVTEYGAAELEGKTVQERGEALAAIAHPEFRDELLAAAERASKGRSPVA